MSAISRYPDIHLLARADAAWEREPGRIIMDSLLRIYPKIDAVYSHNDRIAPGAFEAAEKLGRAKDIVFVGIDALPGQREWSRAGVGQCVGATFIYPTNGDKVLEMAMNILEKKPFARETTMETAIVDPITLR